MADATPLSPTAAADPLPNSSTHMPLSIIEVAIRIVSAMGCDKDAPTPHDYGVIVANLVMLRNNCPTPLWNEELWDYLAMPEEVHPEKYKFLTKTHHTQLLTNKLDELYEQHC